MIYTGEVEPFKSLFVVHEGNVNKYKELQSKLAASEGDRETAVTNWMESSDDQQAVKIREQVEKLNQRLRDLAEKNVVSEELSEDAKAALNTELETLKQSIKDGSTALTKASEFFASEKDNVLKALEEIGNPAVGRRGRAPGSAGSNLPRASVHISITGGKYTDTAPLKYDTFSAAATGLNAEVRDLLEAFAKAANVELNDVKTVKTPQKFDVQVGDTLYHFATTPKERKTRSDSKTAESESAEQAA